MKGTGGDAYLGGANFDKILFDHFVAQFDKATWVEDLKTDADGKISAFEIHPPDNAGK